MNLARADQALDRLAAETVRARATAAEKRAGAQRFVRPDWTPMQNRLSEWIDSRLSSAGAQRSARLEGVEAELNAELDRLGLLARQDADEEGLG